MIQLVSRPVNQNRPEELRGAIVQYLIEHGLADLSLRPLAKAIGSSPRGLLYYFGSKEKMVIECIAEFRRRQRASFGRVEGATASETCWNVWKLISSAESEPLFRLFFEAYGIALRNPDVYQAFLHDGIEEWLIEISEPLVRGGVERAQARSFATVMLAGLRGFMLDYCATRDRERLDQAVRLWAACLDAMVATGKMD